MPRHAHRADAGPIGVRVARAALAALILAAVTASLGFATSGGQQAPPPPVAAAAPPSEPAATPRPSPADTAPAVRVPVVRATPGSRKRTTPPTEVLYPRLDLKVPVVPTGVTGDGQMEIPGDAATAGWYRYGRAPAEGAGSTVIAAHNGSPQTPVGPFNALAEARKGDEIRLRDAADRQRGYRVVSVQHRDKEGLDLTPYFARTGAPSLVLVTCGGQWLPERGTYSDNVIVVAHPVD